MQTASEESEVLFYPINIRQYGICFVKFNSNVNVLFGRGLPVLCGCAASALTTKTRSPAGSWPQVLLEIKPEISAHETNIHKSPIFLVTSLLPAAESNHIGFCTFSLMPPSNHISPPTYCGATESFLRHWWMRMVHMYVVNYVNKRK